eukprot:1192094-Prorocentrum_minimum.AAC.2
MRGGRQPVPRTDQLYTWCTVYTTCITTRFCISRAFEVLGGVSQGRRFNGLRVVGLIIRPHRVESTVDFDRWWRPLEDGSKGRIIGSSKASTSGRLCTVDPATNSRLWLVPVD